ncbi:hypothetical protein FDECE_12255 [Fusarium decemcellulare]|nr:hypothetical protein FDECE_12255 [Fusarium decemcellulare]
MAGFEIAGIVLGSLPLLISAIEHYESNLDRATAFFKWQDELGRALRRFWYQHSLYEMTLRNVLKDIASPIEVEEMISEPQHDLWASLKLREKLEDRLKSAYRPYLLTIKEMESCMKTLAGHLDIERQIGTADELEAIIQANQALPSAQGRPTFEFKRAIKLTMKRKGIRNLLADITSCNERLDKFITKAETLSQQTVMDKASLKSVLSSSLQRIQSYATLLHQTLSRAWCCSAHDCHHVRLLLEDRMVRREDEKSLRRAKTDSKPTCFTVSHKPPVKSTCWQIAEIEVTDESFEKSHGATTVRFQVPSAGFTTPKSQRCEDCRPLEDLKAIKSLCSIFCRSASPKSGLGFKIGANGTLHGTYAVPTRPVCCSEDFISLHDLLFKQPKTRKLKPLTDEDRYILAITLTSSFLQLYSTPWLPRYWSQHNIMFSTICVGDQHLVDVRHPFVLEAYQQGGAQATWPHVTFGDDNANLLALAKLLLEIKFHGRKESTRLEEDLGQNPAPDQVTDFQTLNRWITQERGNLSFAHYDAILFCILSSNNIEADLGDLMFRQTVLNKVVVPLVDELNYWRGAVL